MKNAALRRLFAVAAASAAGPAWACAVCGAGQRDPAADAFFASTVLMSLVPVGMIGGTLFYLMRSVRRTKDRTSRREI